MTPDQDERSAQAKAYSRATQALSISLEMVVPGLLGMWLDRLLGRRMLFTILGFALGFVMGLWHLIRWTSTSTAQSVSSRDGDDTADEDRQ